MTEVVRTGMIALRHPVFGYLTPLEPVPYWSPEVRRAWLFRSPQNAMQQVTRLEAKGLIERETADRLAFIVIDEQYNILTRINAEPAIGRTH